MPRASAPGLASRMMAEPAPSNAVGGRARNRKGVVRASVAERIVRNIVPTPTDALRGGSLTDSDLGTAWTSNASGQGIELEHPLITKHEKGACKAKGQKKISGTGRTRRVLPGPIKRPG